MKFDNPLPQEFRQKISAEIGRTREGPAPASKFGRKTGGATPMSKVEAAFAEEWAPAHGVAILAKEALALAISEGRVYTPDFLVATEDGIALVEVKSENPLPNEQRAIFAFKDASTRNPQVEFWWARQVGGGFSVAAYRGGEQCGSR